MLSRLGLPAPAKSKGGRQRLHRVEWPPGRVASDVPVLSCSGAMRTLTALSGLPVCAGASGSDLPVQHFLLSLERVLDLKVRCTNGTEFLCPSLGSRDTRVRVGPALRRPVTPPPMSLAARVQLPYVLSSVLSSTLPWPLMFKERPAPVTTRTPCVACGELARGWRGRPGVGLAVVVCSRRESHRPLPPACHAPLPPCEGRVEAIGDPGPHVGPRAFWLEGAWPAALPWWSPHPPPHPLRVLPSYCFWTLSHWAAPGCVCRLWVTVQPVSGTPSLVFHSWPLGVPPGFVLGPWHVRAPVLDTSAPRGAPDVQAPLVFSLSRPWDPPCLPGACPVPSQSTSGGRTLRREDQCRGSCCKPGV